MRPVLAVLALLALAGCASAVDRVVAEAMRTPAGHAEYIPSTDTTMGPALAQLEARLKVLGVSVTYADLSHAGQDGQTIGGQTRDNQILLEETLTRTGRLEVLAHEAGHLFHPRTLSYAEKQVFAELVGVEVCARLGWDIERVAGRYLGIYKNGIAGALAFKVDRERAVRILLGEEDP